MSNNDSLRVTVHNQFRPFPPAPAAAAATADVLAMLGDDLSPLDAALESDDIYEVAADFGATLTSAELLGAIDDTIHLCDEAR